MILVDSSVWVDFLRDADTRASGRLREAIAEGAELAITEPIVMELLTGARTPRQIHSVEALVNGLPLLPLDAAIDFRAAADLYRASLAHGHPIRSMIDCLIASVAIRTGATLLHKDRDFGFLAEISPLDVDGAS